MKRELLTAIATGAALSAFVLGACTATVGEPRNDVAGGGASGNGAGGGAAGQESGPGGSTTPTVARQRCEETRVGPALLRRLTRAELENTLLDVFPEISAGFGGTALGTDSVSELGFSTDASLLVVGNQTAEEWLETAEDVAALVTEPATLATILPCSGNTPDTSCAEEFIGRYGRRLFRRPVTESERGRYLDHFDSVAARSDFPMGIKWMLVSMLESPHAVYRSEIGIVADGKRELSPYEVATQLAYTFGGTTPSDALLDKAEAGELTAPEARIAQARELLSTARGREVVHRFFREWIGYQVVTTKVKTTDDAFMDVRGAMAEETRRYIEDVVIQNDGSVEELLTANHTYVDADLAAFYGFGPVEGGFARVERPEDWGKGLLAQGSVMASFAHSESSSPTLRGLLVYERMFCNDRPTPPPDIPSIEPPEANGATTRARYEESHAQGSCNNCHRFFDPIGFGFEHFDNTGRFRAFENGEPIDASGEVLDFQSNEVFGAFDDHADLAELLASRREVEDCLSGLVAVWAFSGGGGESCLAEDARSALSSGEIGLHEYMAQLAGAPQLVERKLE